MILSFLFLPWPEPVVACLCFWRPLRAPVFCGYPRTIQSRTVPLFSQALSFRWAWSWRVFAAWAIHLVPPDSPSSPVWALNQSSRAACLSLAHAAASGKSSSVVTALAQSSSVHSASSGFSAICLAISASSSGVGVAHELRPVRVHIMHLPVVGLAELIILVQVPSCPDHVVWPVVEDGQGGIPEFFFSILFGSLQLSHFSASPAE